MAWTSPRTYVAGETVNAAILNTHLRDNLNFLLPSQTVTDVAFNTGNFVGLAPMTWTVQSGDMLWQWYYRLGTRVIYSVALQAASITGTPTATVRITTPPAFAMRGGTPERCARAICGSTYMSAYVNVGTSNRLDITVISHASWPLANNNMVLEFTHDVLVFP